MSQQQNALTYEGVLELIRQVAELQKETDRIVKENAAQQKETDRRFRETDRKFQETDRKFQEAVEERKRTQRIVGKLGSRIGDIVENMVRGNIVEKFQALGYDVTEFTPNKPFKYKELGIIGEIDLFLDEGDTAILIEVKTTLETADVREHIERLEKYRRYIDAKYPGDKKRVIGAVAGAVVKGVAAEFAHENGMYVIVQSGDAVKIVTSPDGFQVKEW